MVNQQVMAAVSKHVRLPLWKRLLLITALLLPGESLVAVVSSPVSHADAACNGGYGGPGGVANYVNDGGRGGNGGDCLIVGSAKGGTGGTSNANGANGGNVFFLP